MNWGLSRGTILDGIKLTLLYLFLFFVLCALISYSHAVVSVTTAVICLFFTVSNDNKNGENGLWKVRGSLVYLCLGIAVTYSRYSLIPMYAFILLPAIAETVKRRELSSKLFAYSIVAAILSFQWWVMVSTSSLTWSWLIGAAGGCVGIIFLIEWIERLVARIRRARKEKRDKKIREENERRWHAEYERHRKIQEEEERKREVEKAREEEQRRQKEAETERAFQELLATPEGRTKLARGLVKFEVSPTTVSQERTMRCLLETQEGREALADAFRDAEGNAESMAYLTKLWRKRSTETMKLCIAKAQDIVRQGQDPFDCHHFRGIRNY